MFAAYRNHAAVYRSLDVETSLAGADPHKMIAMLFDGAVAAMQRARSAIGSGDLKTKTDSLNRAVRIVDEGLKASLDPAGGVLTVRLRDLYTYVSGRLLTASLRNDVAAIDEAERLIDQLRDAWSQIAPAPAGARRSLGTVAA